jgi:predicted nucleotidyltransferase component of viral defense system
MPRKAIERFHLLFCIRLGARIDRNLFALKGGCNLRFYFRSIRYSKDIDFDVRTISVETLKKNVKQILDDMPFRTVLRNIHNIEVLDWSAPKQTETTQRWKVSLRVGNQILALPTKIEFSRRNPEMNGTETQFVNSELITGYNLSPVLIQHYMLPKAIEQKISALINRTETQARDVVDLLFLKNRLSRLDTFPMLESDRIKATETLMSISFEDFKSQVWPYMMPDYQEDFGRRARWDEIQSDVVQFIETQPVIKI